MARLNEPTAQVESVEALKRRFVRQNREIARVNSTQSLRIRNLESEVSRLLSENITLREQIIKLQFEIDNRVGAESINTVKRELETKLAELGGLVRELGNLQQSAEDRRAVRRRSGVKSSPKESPAQKNWKNALNISEVSAGADGRLPPIVEGKYYPRRTLDADEMLELLPDDGDPADSPDLGPPPIAHFEAGDPIKFDSIQQESPRRAKLETAGGLNPALLANLETRRKRRGSSQSGEKEDTSAESINSQRSQQKEMNDQPKPGHSLKSGAKRKLSAREDEEHLGRPFAPERDTFQYNRIQENPPHDDTEREKSGAEGKEQQAQQRASDEPKRMTEKSRGRPKANSNPAISNRNILAPKSVNNDPVSSPAKIRRPAEGEKVAKPDVSKPRERSRTRDQPASQRFARPAKVPPSEAPEAKTSQQSLEVSAKSAPKTPAPPPLDTFSPDGSEPPATRPEGRDTPPPADLDPDSANTNAFGSLGRASRRQRGSVSYAEPNLRDKMRRPTKDLVDAVGADDRLKDKKAIKIEADPLDLEPIVLGDAPSKMRTVIIKKENAADDSLDWKMLPTKGHETERDRIGAEAPSPLENKAAVVKADLPASVVTERRRRSSVLDHERFTGEARSQDSGSGSAIAALMTEESKPRPRENNTQTEQPEEAAKPIEAPGIYDVQESSPAEAENVIAKARETKPAAVRTSRRHSSISDDRIKEALARRAERRKEVPSDMRPSSKASGPPDLKSVRSAATVAVEARDGSQGRGERAASRRRSMML
ncbi:MAG: hypothetical protein LQ343_004143 [Gyalolechia ehrenbergii]|nr:MAG: hypothetical protein LQ343_004143 [Gyalolechia ehrenbergii]